ncbi:lysophospholipase L1-like esterase [Opitutaceae bacterium TAV1]|nr:lysophospholipase L1-like esterase [Opitutaceae bacterium TAV1]
MIQKIRLLTLAAALVATGLAPVTSAASSSDADGFYLKDGDRVVFYGDSITDQRLYTTFTETFVVTRFPAMNVSFTHSGWGGDRVTGGGGGKIDVRLERDVYAYNPTVMTIMLGMNDGSYRAFDQGIFDTYKNGLTSIVEKVQKKLPGLRLTLIQPSPYDDVTRAPRFSGGYNEVLVRYGAAVKEIASANNQNVADLNTSVVAMLEKAKATDAKLAEKIIPDRVHPGGSGHLIMAAALLKSWNAPAIVTDVAIDAAASRITRAENTRVTGLNVTPAAITWSQLDAALPMPVDMGNAETVLAVRSSGFIAELDRQPLRVTGLTAAGYDLAIDGKPVGHFTPAQLAEGINLATLATPMAAQAAEVHKLTMQRANLHNIRWRTFQVPYANADEAIRASLPDVMKALDDADLAAARMQRAAAQPVVRRYELKGLTQDQIAAQGVPAEQLPAGVALQQNLALDKKWKSTAPNTYGWDSGLTDGSWAGNSKNTWATDDKDTFPKSVTIDLDTPATIGHIVIGVPAFGSTKTVAVSISADGQNFTEVGRYAFSLRKEEKRLFNFEPATARYVRLTYVDHHAERVNYNNTFAFTTDVQVFAPAR